jgi:hypothetical protein
VIDLDIIGRNLFQMNIGTVACQFCQSATCANCGESGYYCRASEVFGFSKPTPPRRPICAELLALALVAHHCRNGRVAVLRDSPVYGSGTMELVTGTPREP